MADITVVKRDGSQQLFDANKINLTLLAANDELVMLGKTGQRAFRLLHAHRRFGARIPGRRQGRGGDGQGQRQRQSQNERSGSHVILLFESRNSGLWNHSASAL